MGGTTTAYGRRDLNLGFTREDAREHVLANRRRFLVAAGAVARRRPWPLVTARQIHSDLIHVISAAPAEPPAGDGLVTNAPELALAIQTADCHPILIVDTRNRAVGAFHAGWHGTLSRIVLKGLGVMRYEYGTRPQDVLAVLGPGIQECSYEVGEDLREQFESQFSYGHELFREFKDSDPVRERYPLLFLNARAPGHGDLCIKLFLDLREANRRQLLEAGVPERHITVLPHCTACDTRQFFSHRAEKGHTGRMMAVIGLRK